VQDLELLEEHDAACTDVVVSCGGVGETCGVNPLSPAGSAARIPGPALCTFQSGPIAPALSAQTTIAASPDNDTSFPVSLQTVILLL
jgi:hypothetical protein